jgi:hypothetical protein
MLKTIATLTGAVLLAVSAPLAAEAQSVPNTISTPNGLNLGSTSFFDGYGRQTQGWSLVEYDRVEDDTAITAQNGKPSPLFTGTKIHVFVALTQAIYSTDWHPMGGTFAFSAALPIVDYIETSFSPSSLVKLNNNGTNIGDLVWGPIYQSKVFKKAGRPLFVWRAQLIIQSPTGALNPNKNINQGDGFWAINPYVTFTYTPTSKLEFSNRFNYQYNFQGDRFSSPPPIPHFVYRDGQGGQMIYDNFAASYAILPKLNFGVDGFYLNQLTPNKTNGINVQSNLRYDLYAGPGLHYAFDGSNSINLNSYLQVICKVDSCGPKLNVQYIHRF